MNEEIRSITSTEFKLAVRNLQFAKRFCSLQRLFGIFSKICELPKSELFIELAM